MAWRLYECPAKQEFGRKRVAATYFLGLIALLIAFSGTAPGARAQGYNDPVYHPTPVRSSGGVLGFLFGGSGPQYRHRDPYESGESYHYSPAPKNGGGYRTLCVRLCDGYYWPLSFSTGREGLMRDVERCESSCKTPAKLFFHHSSGSTDSMIDLEGQPYSRLEHAFRYRSEYVSDCKCKPDPWSEEAKLEYANRAEIELAADTTNGHTEQPLAEGAAPQPASRTYVTPVDSRQRPRRERVIENFNPFGRWFN